MPPKLPGDMLRKIAGSVKARTVAALRETSRNARDAISANALRNAVTAEKVSFLEGLVRGPLVDALRKARAMRETIMEDGGFDDGDAAYAGAGGVSIVITPRTDAPIDGSKFLLLFKLRFHRPDRYAPHEPIIGVRVNVSRASPTWVWPTVWYRGDATPWQEPLRDAVEMILRDEVARVEAAMRKNAEAEAKRENEKAQKKRKRNGNRPAPVPAYTFWGLKPT